MTDREPLTRTYRFALGICKPTVRWWGRLGSRASSTCRRRAR